MHTAGQQLLAGVAARDGRHVARDASSHRAFATGTRSGEDKYLFNFFLNNDLQGHILGADNYLLFNYLSLLFFQLF